MTDHAFPRPRPLSQLGLYPALDSVTQQLKTVLFGPYLIEKSREHTFTLMSKAETPIFEQLAEHFEGLWLRWSREPPAEWFSLTPPGVDAGRAGAAS